MSNFISQFLISLLLVNTTTAYFEYEDCDTTCQISELPCILSKTLNNDFSSICCKTSSLCELRASHVVACIQRNHPTIGGKDIWSEFEQSHRHTTTTTTEKPMPDNSGSNCRSWRFSFLFLSISVFISTLSMFSLKMYRVIASRNSDSMQVLNSPILNEDDPAII